MMRYVLFAILAIWVAGPASAECGTAGKAACFTDCESNESVHIPPRFQSAKDWGCWEFDESATVNDDSGAILVSTSSVLFDFDPDRTATSAPGSGAEIDIRRCTGGVWPGSCDPNLCAPLNALTSGTSLDGTEGNAADQNKMIRVGPGVYCIDITVVAPGAGDDPIVEIRGE